MASARADGENHNSMSKKAMTNPVIDLDKDRLKLCIEILPEADSTERIVIISICREQGMPLIRTISLNELAPIPLPLAEVIQAYATSELANQIPIIEEENLEPIAITKRSLAPKSQQMALL
ncbi:MULTISPECIES: hypothetical protein [Pseudanabaena]|uniref:Uncharacterized protein n=2 Tax=Pseudanabaena TaxID=1152 RepID=L8MVA9_9CYAN|nr:MULTISPECIES: hypothetical protein [Pseudanabaena]ELS31882.1 hypothetical protein Pse7429DRAFT_3077 [Pseudanabaena biceps PCC 7429]MDG3495880.1 hypothetical protein [Pseudanabaena catenata USMAC16]